MSIYKGDFPEGQRRDIELVAERLGITFAGAMRNLLEMGITYAKSTGYILSSDGVITEETGEPIGGGLTLTPATQEGESSVKGESRGGAVQATKRRKKSKPEPEPLPELPTSVNSPQVIEAWNDFVEMRRRKGKQCEVTAIAAKLMFRKFEKWGPDKTLALVNKAVEQNYRGVFDDDKIPNAPRRAEIAKPPSPPVDYALEEAKESARQLVLDKLLLASDGWSGSTRAMALDKIADAKDQDQINLAVGGAVLLDASLRRVGAYPLRPPKIGEFELGLLFSKSGAKWRVAWDQALGGWAISKHNPAQTADSKEVAGGDGPSTAGLCIDPPGFEILSDYPPNGDDDNPDFGHGEDMVGDDTPLGELATRRWTGPLDDDLQPDGQALKVPVPGKRWPYGPPEDHDDCCGLHSGGLFCDCKASADEDFCSRCGAMMVDDGAGGETCIRCEAEEVKGETVDLMAALKASLAAKGWKG